MKFGIFLITFISCLAGCSEPTSQPKGMLSENLNCPNGSHSEISRYGGVGESMWVHSCKMNHGAFHVWRNDVITIEGDYSNGKETGTWIYRDNNGDVTQTINYDSK